MNILAVISNGFSQVLGIAKQIIDDLFGKDAVCPETYTYTWLSDQWGHFSLGFVGTAIVCKLYGISFLGIPFAVPLSFFILGVVKELRDFFAMDTEYRKLKLADKFGCIPLTENVLSALFYYALGISSATSLFLGLNTFLIVNAICLVLFSGMAIPFLAGKLFFQKANLPTLLRFFFFDWGSYTNANVKLQQTKSWLQNPDKSLVIIGDTTDAKTMLATALGTELAFKWKKVLYTSFVSFLEQDSIDSDWTAQEVDFLIIDDICTSANSQLITSQEFKATIDNLSAAKKELLKKKLIIVIGADNTVEWSKICTDLFGPNLVIELK